MDEEMKELRGEAHPIDSISKPEIQQLIRDAIMIVGFDISREDEGAWALFYGKEILTAITQGRGDEWPEHNLLAFTYSQNTDELERLCAWIEVIKGKGSCCYEGFS